MAIAGAQRKQVLKVLILSLLLDLVRSTLEANFSKPTITFTQTDNIFRSPLHSFCHSSLRCYRFIAHKIRPRIPSSTASSTT